MPEAKPARWVTMLESYQHQDPETGTFYDLKAEERRQVPHDLAVLLCGHGFATDEAGEIETLERDTRPATIRPAPVKASTGVR